MSLYIGKDNTSTAVLHLTQGPTDLASMKAGVLSNTVFHSELPYITWEQVQCTPVVIRDIPFISISAEDAVALGTGKNIYFMCIGNTIIQGIQLVNNFETSMYSRKFGGWYSIYNYNGGFYQPTGYPTAQNRYFLPYWGSNLANIALYKLNIQNGVYQGVPKTTNEILINPPTFNVRGVNLLAFKYFSPNIVNSIDKVVNCAGSNFQLVNSSIPATISLVSNTTESSIYKDNQILFSSLINSHIRYYGYGVAGTAITSSRSFTLPSDSIGSVVVLYLKANSVYGFYTGPHYLPIILKIGSGNIVTVYNLVRYDDGYSYFNFSIIANSNSGIISLQFSTNNSGKSVGSWDISYTYFK